ncbi:MAG: 50S ribosomal protein L29 [Chloroflexi bacterium]|nr:50S ribosomal protein L29 [Chloroflexota bacterium]
MPAADIADLRAMSEADLRNELEETQRALFNLRFQAATRQLADVSQVRTARRRVARIKTLLHQRELLAAYGELVEAAAASGDDADQEE